MQQKKIKFQIRLCEHRKRKKQIKKTTEIRKMARKNNSLTVLEQFRINAIQAGYLIDLENETAIKRADLFRMAVLTLKKEYDKIRIPLKKQAKEKVSLGVESETIISELKRDCRKGVD